MLCCGGSIPGYTALLLALIQLPLSSAVISLRNTNKDDDGHKVSPIAGCVGFDCVQRFVAMPDRSYSWYDTGERIHGYNRKSKAKWNGYILNMTSQVWETEAKVDFPTWWHILVVVVPDNLEFKDFASLSLDFGMNLPSGELVRIDNRDNADPIQDTMQPCIAIDSTNLKQRLPVLKYAVSKIAYIATNAHTIGVSLLDLPNSYEVFGTDITKRRRSMDFLKAFAYIDFLGAGAKEPERISELPIAKALVRAMDTVSAFTKAKLPSGMVKRFGVTGYSKLGTIAWMAGALDPRVKAIAPAAIPLDLHDKGFTPQEDKVRLNEIYSPPRDIVDFKEKGLMIAAGEQYMPLGYFAQHFEVLNAIVSPVAWMSRLQLPKLYVMGSNDLCFQSSLDKSQKLFDQLPGQKAFLEIPNCKHEDTLVKALPSIAAFFHGVLINRRTPEIWSEFNEKTGLIRARLVSDHKPLNITLWTADTSLSRDFHTATWIPKRLGGGSAWQAKLRKTLGTGYRAGFIEFKYAYPDDHHVYSTSTPVSVVPSQEL